MNAVSQEDVQHELTELEVEEARIMRELEEMDEKQHSAAMMARGRVVAAHSDPGAALNALLLDCEKEVRDAKGYIASAGPPLQIARCKPGETVPKHGTFLSRPKGTGVDFTVPVTLKDYYDTIKTPIFLNTIRDKCRTKRYVSSEDYLEDMRLLARNTAAFNRGPELAWVVQHERLLLEAAEDAVTSRRLEFYELEEALRRASAKQTPSTSSVGKRKRSAAVVSPVADASPDPRTGVNVGTVIQVFWDSDRKWHHAKVIGRGTGSQVHVEYDDEGSEWLDLHHEVKWRLPSGPTSGRGRRSADSTAKRRKTSAAPIVPDIPVQVQPQPQSLLATPGVSEADLKAVKDEMLARMEGSQVSVINTVQDHFLRIEGVLSRSDALHRVLIAVQDMQAALGTRIEAMQEDIAELRSKVTDFAKDKQGTASTAPSERPNGQGPVGRSGLRYPQHTMHFLHVGGPPLHFPPSTRATFKLDIDLERGCRASHHPPHCCVHE